MNAKVEPGMPSIVTTVVTPLEMLSRAIDRGVDAGMLEKLMELKERHEANEAKKAFNDAMTALKSKPLVVTKNKHVKFGNTEYDHATLAQVVDAVVSRLSEHGLSHRWETDQSEGGLISVTCIITHALGHEQRTRLCGVPDSSGSKNSIQAVGSTVTYLQRYTLMAATGLASHEMDDDAKGAAPAETITEKQAADLQALIDEIASEPVKYRERLCKYHKIASLTELPAKAYPDTVAQLEAKRGK